MISPLTAPPRPRCSKASSGCRARRCVVSRCTMWSGASVEEAAVLLAVGRRVPHGDVQLPTGRGPLARNRFLDVAPAGLRELATGSWYAEVVPRPGQPAVAVVRHPLRRPGQLAADHHRRVRLLHRLGVADDRAESPPTCRGTPTPAWSTAPSWR